MGSTEGGAKDPQLLRLSNWSTVAAIVLYAASFAFIVTLFNLKPTCVFPLNLPVCWSEYPELPGAISTLVGGLLLTAGVVFLDRRGHGVGGPFPRVAPRRARIETALALAGIIVLLVAAVVGFAPSPRRDVVLTNAQLTPQNESAAWLVAGATVSAYANEVVTGVAAVVWFDNATSQAVTTLYEVLWIQPGNSLANLTRAYTAYTAGGYVVPRDGVYTVFFLSWVCEDESLNPACYSHAYHAVAWLNFTAANPTLFPAIQMGTAIGGCGTFAAALVVIASDRRSSASR